MWQPTLRQGKPLHDQLIVPSRRDIATSTYPASLPPPSDLAFKLKIGSA
jgi:hypothetical protein